MINAHDALYETQGRFDQIRAYIDAGKASEAESEARDGVITIGSLLESVGYMPPDNAPENTGYDRLYEAQGALDQIRVYLEAMDTESAMMDSLDWIEDIAGTLKEVGYTPPKIPGQK